MNITNKDLKRRIIEISYKYNLSHLGSCLTAVDIIDEIFKVKKPDEKFVLSSGHAGLALYVVLEKYTKGDATGLVPGLDAEQIFNHHGVHPDYCEECHIDCSSGSLGNGLPIAVGMALGNRKKNVYCLISDGECAEGSIFEALRIVDECEITNLDIRCNFNQWGAYKETNMGTMPQGNKILYYYTHVEQLPFLKGQDAHYYTMTEEDYQQAMDILT